MIEYDKIQSIYKRDERTHQFIEGQFSTPEIAYLKDNLWSATEKIDGTNMSAMWDWTAQCITINGRTKDAQIPVFLIERMKQLFTVEKMSLLYPNTSMTLFGEGYGAKIQGGGKYIPDGCDFILFDILVGTWWLDRENIEDVATKLGLRVVPIVGTYTLPQAIDMVKAKVLTSTFGSFLAEGVVLKPLVELHSRKGYRIITKIKHKDWR